MAEIISSPFMDALENGWGRFVQRFQQLLPEAQASVLKQQGYACLADLLAHVIGWWEEGLEAVRRLPAEPDFSSPEHDVDTFNAQSVRRFQGAGEAEVIQIFEALRLKWLDLVKSLPESALQNKRITDRLYMELVGHLEEHQF